MSEREELLQRVPLFEGLDARELRAIGEALRERFFEPGELVMSEGAPGAGFFVIESGEAVVTIGGEERTRLGRGDTFGEIALIADDVRTATVTAAAPLYCLGLTAWEFRPLVERDPRIAWNLIQSIGRLLRDSELRAQRD